MNRGRKKDSIGVDRGWFVGMIRLDPSVVLRTRLDFIVNHHFFLNLGLRGHAGAWAAVILLRKIVIEISGFNVYYQQKLAYDTNEKSSIYKIESVDNLNIKTNYFC